MTKTMKIIMILMTMMLLTSDDHETDDRDTDDHMQHEHTVIMQEGSMLHVKLSMRVQNIAKRR